MSLLVVYWGIFFLASSLALNLLSVVIHLNSWHLYQRNPRSSSSSSPAAVEDQEKTGYFLYLFIVFTNIIFLVRMHDVK